MNRTRGWSGLLIAAVMIVGAGCGGGGAKKEYKQAVVKKGDLYEKVSVRGNFDSLTDANVANLQQSSLVVEILVEEGDRVKKGDVMAKLSSRDRENLINTATILLENLKRQAKKQGGADEALAKEIKQAEEELTFAREEYQIVPVLAPLDGVVSARRKNEGESTYTNETMFVLRDKLIVKCDVNEADIAKVKIGQTVEAVPDAYPDKKCYGDVYAIANYGDNQQNVINFEVKSELRQLDSELKLGMTADVDIIIEKAEDVLYLPVEFVQFEPKEEEKKEGEEEKKEDRKGKKRKSTRHRDAWRQGVGKRNYSKDPKWEKEEGTKFVLSGDKKEPEKIEVETGFTNNIKVAITKGLEEGVTVYLEKVEKKKEEWK